MRSVVLALFVVCVAGGACAPQVDGPVEAARARDRAEERRLEAALRALPGVTGATVALDRPVRDPLSLAAPGPASLRVALVADARAGSAARAIAATTGVTPELAITAPAIAARPAGASHAFKLLLVGALAVIAILAALLAQAYRRGKSAR